MAGECARTRDVIQRAVTLSERATIDSPDIHLDSRSQRGNSVGQFVLPQGMTLDQWEQETIREALKRANGNKSQAARLLGLSRNALRYRLSQMGVADAPEGE